MRISEGLILPLIYNILRKASFGKPFLMHMIYADVSLIVWNPPVCANHFKTGFCPYFQLPGVT